MFNELYNTPLAVRMSQTAFNGCEQGSGMGRQHITTGKGVYYSATQIGENRVLIQKSQDNGFTWEKIKTFQNLEQSIGTSSNDGGIAFSIDYSEIDQVLYAFYIETGVGGHAGDKHIILYDVTNDTEIGPIAETTIDAHGSRFCFAGHVDRKVMLGYQDDTDSDKFKASLIDINHYTAAVRDMEVASGQFDSTVTVGTGASNVVGLFDISEDNQQYYMWFVSKADGNLYRKEITEDDLNETYGSNANIVTYTTAGNEVVTEIFACHDACLFSVIDTVTQANSRLKFYSVESNTVYSVPFIEGNSEFAIDSPASGTYQYYAWPKMIKMFDAVNYFQLFFMGRNSSGVSNQLETVDIKSSDGTMTTPVKVTKGITARSWEIDDQYFDIFEPPELTVWEKTGRGAILTAISNGKPRGFGHRHGDCVIYTEFLANNAYPHSITSTKLSVEQDDYVSNGDTDRYYNYFERAIAVQGFDAVIFKYAIVGVPSTRGLISYETPTETETKIMLNELTLRNPSNTRLEDSEVFADVREKDIRKVYFSANNYLEREFKKSREGFIFRTVYLMKFYGRFYEITQVVPIYGTTGIICYRANLYVVGANYNPFTRTVLPNEN